jgi:peptide/nickel transport system permease protein
MSSGSSTDVQQSVGPPGLQTGLGAAPAEAGQPQTHWQHAWRHFRRDRFAVGAGVVVILLFIIAGLAPWVSPHNPLTQFADGLSGDFGEPIAPGQSERYMLGTDTLGRDFFSRLLWGGRISLVIALAANLMRLIDLVLSFPSLILQIALATVLPPSLTTVIIVITIFAWAYPARIFRGQILSLRERPFVEASRALGAGQFSILFRHIIPQLWPTVIVFATLRVPAAILTEAGLSFVGLGVRPPTPSWGNLILEGFRYYRSAPWLILYPGLAIMLTVLAFNLLGDGLRDALDPREQHLAQV